MFRRTNNRQNQNVLNGQNPGRDIREEPTAEKPFLNIGNEAANRADGFPDIISNEANNAIDAPDETLSHYAGNDLSYFKRNTDAGNKQKEIPPEIIREGL